MSDMPANESVKCCSHTECYHDEHDEYDKCAYILGDDMTFPKATIDPKLIKLQKEVTEFITSVILNHEKEFYNLIKLHFENNLSQILGLTCNTIIEMITSTTTKFYNKIYYNIQHSIPNPIADIIIEMCEYAGYGPHILLDKLFRLTYDIHIEIVREKLDTENDFDIYQKTVLNQLNLYLPTINLLHLLSKDEFDDSEFAQIPDGQNAFNIVIDKNIGV
jgi:hypothetical protein